MNDSSSPAASPETLPEASVFDSEPLLLPATTGQRFVNFLIDLALVLGLTYGFFYVLMNVLFALFPDLVREMVNELQTNPGYGLLDRLLTAFVMVLFYTLIEGASKGRSLGKLITNTQAVTENGESLSWGKAFRRSLCRLVPFETFSGLSGFPWHDTWTGTMVVRRKAQL